MNFEVPRRQAVSDLGEHCGLEHILHGQLRKTATVKHTKCTEEAGICCQDIADVTGCQGMLSASY